MRKKGGKYENKRPGIAYSEKAVFFNLSMAKRHGLIAEATGAGKVGRNIAVRTGGSLLRGILENLLK